MTATCILLAAMSFSDVAALTRTEAAHADDVCATGVVTQVVGWRSASGVFADVADPNGRGIYFSGETLRTPTAHIDGADSFRLGDVIEVKGVATPLAFAPGIKASSIKIVGRLPLPPFAEKTLFDLRGGRLDNARVKMKGVVSGVRQMPQARLDPNASVVQLSVSADEGLFLAHVPGRAEEWRPLLDAEVEVSGCAMSSFSVRAEFRGVQLEVASPDDVVVTKAAPGSPFDREATSVADLMAYSPVPRDAHARKVRGVVTYSEQAFCYIQDGEHGLKVSGENAHGFRSGDVVEAVGFPLVVDRMSELRCMAARKTGSASLPEPFEGYTLADYARWMYYANAGAMVDIEWRRVAFSARVIRVDERDGAAELILADGSVTSRVRFNGPVPEFLSDAERLHPLVRVCAVAELSVSDATTDDRMPVLRGISFAAASPDDITFVPDAEWRACLRETYSRNAAWVAVVFLLALTGGGVWSILCTRRERGRIAAITAERKRMAADLHDTIEQNLAGAKMLMESSLSIAPEVPPAVEEAVKGAAAILAHAKSEIRATIFNLRCDEMFDRRPEDVFREMMRHLDRGKVNARCRLRGLPDHLPGAFFSDLIGIVQEATTNALKHGRAKNIVLVSDPLTGDGKRGFVLRVLNDGEPFDAAAALGPESGHFGLSGMRERAKRNGMRISWGTKDKWTSVKVEVAAI